MKTRILFGAVLIAAVVGVLYLDWHLERADVLGPWVRGLPLAMAVVCILPLAFGELARLGRAAGLGLLTPSGLGVAAAVGLAPWWSRLCWPGGAGDWPLVLAGVGLMVIFTEQMVRFRAAEAVHRIAATVLGAAYLGVGTAAMVSIRMTWSLEALVVFLAAVKGTDIGAYFVGLAAGRHKLIPWLSPAKSWEGLAGGVVLGAAAAVLAVWALGVEALGLGQAVVFGVVLAVAGQFADLCESLLKRSVQIKDSGAVVPTFGGVLDILDSPLLSAPLAWLLLAVMMGL